MRTLPASDALGYLADILELAESLTASAQRAQNLDYASYCRRAARDFHAAAVRRLTREPCNEQYARFAARAERLDASLSSAAD
jgi:hypothetical protein